MSEKKYIKMNKLAKFDMSHIFNQQISLKIAWIYPEVCCLPCIGPTLFAASALGAMGPLELELKPCLVFSAIIVAVDPVAVSIISQLHKKTQLYTTSIQHSYVWKHNCYTLQSVLKIQISKIHSDNLMCLLSEYEMAMAGLCRWTSKSKISGEVLLWKTVQILKRILTTIIISNHSEVFYGSYGNLCGNEPLKHTIINVVLYDSMMFW